MPEKKKQHYVPQFLLKNFTDNGKFYIFNLGKNQIIDRPVSYKDQCYTDYFYGVDEKWENYLGNLEAEASQAIRAIISEEAISEAQSIVIKNFILVQYMRTESTVDSNNYMLENALCKLIPIILQTEGHSITKQDARKYAHNIISKNNRTDTAKQNMQFTEKYTNKLNDLHLAVLVSKEGMLLSSDNPVSIDNKLISNGGIGIECAGIIFILPISPQKCILLYDDIMYDFKTENDTYYLSIKEAKLLNRRQFLQARNILYSPDIMTLQTVKKYYDSAYGTAYKDRAMRSFCFRLGIRDTILQNRMMQKLKKNPELECIVPKNIAKINADYFPFINLKDEYVPFIDDFNASFSRFTDPEDLPLKYSLCPVELVKAIKSYLRQKATNRQ